MTKKEFQNKWQFDDEDMDLIEACVQIFNGKIIKITLAKGS